jgi:membrane associated rhomboid family serine protease
MIQLFMVVYSVILSGGIAPTVVNPMIGPWPTILNNLGAKNSALITYRQQWWRLLTPMLLHSGFIHYGVNVLLQLRIGVMLELQWGLGTYALTYIGSGVASSLFSAMILDSQIGVGASGALMGLLGAWLAEISCKWSNGTPEEVHARAGYLVMVVLNILITLSFSTVPYIDWAAHLGGLLGGMMIGGIIFGGEFKSARWRMSVRFGSAFLLSAYFVTAFVIVADVIKPPRELLHLCKLVREQLYDQSIPC